MNAPKNNVDVWLLHHYSAGTNHWFVNVLNQIRPEWRFESIPGRVEPGYSRRIGLYLSGWPRIFLYGMQQAIRMAGRSKRHLIAIAWSHLALLPIILLKPFLANPPHLILYGFIYTPRRSRLLDTCRRWYFRFLLSRLSLVICHSRHECAMYPKWFGHRVRFVYAPFCVNVPQVRDVVPGEYVATAGRSCRDYALLLRVFATLPTQLKIVCDHLAGGQTRLPDNVQVLSGCYDAEYLKVLAGARMVVVPLDVEGVSAGQMVLIQAMALGKPIVVTRTITTEEYVAHRKNGLLVPIGDDKSFRDAIELLLNDSELTATIGQNAKLTYADRYSIQVEARDLVACVDQCFDRLL